MKLHYGVLNHSQTVLQVFCSHLTLNWNHFSELTFCVHIAFRILQMTHGTNQNFPCWSRDFFLFPWRFDPACTFFHFFFTGNDEAVADTSRRVGGALARKSALKNRLNDAIKRLQATERGEDLKHNLSFICSFTDIKINVWENRWFLAYWSFLK